MGAGRGDGVCSTGHPVVMDRYHACQHPQRDAVLWCSKVLPLGSEGQGVSLYYFLQLDVNL